MTYHLKNDEISLLRSWIDCANITELNQIARLLPTPTLKLDEWAHDYLGHYFPLPDSKMHSWLLTQFAEIDQLADGKQPGRRYAVIAPRGGAKTTWVSKTYPLYSAIFHRHPYIVLISNTAAQSEKNLHSIKHELTDNARLLADYPRATGVGPVWTNSRIETNNGVCIEAFGMGAKIRGRTFGPHRPALIVVDDLENDQSVESPTQRQKVKSWFMRAVLPAGTDATTLFVLGSALHRDDLLQNLSQTPTWTARTFRAIECEPADREHWQIWKSIYTDMRTPNREEQARAYFDLHQPAMQEGAELLWPERLGLYELMCLRATIGEAAFQAEMQGQPTSATHAEWPGAYFEGELHFSDWPETRLRVLAIDPSKGARETADYSALVLLGLGTDGLLYVDADLKRRDAAQIVEDGIALALRHRVAGLVIETNQFQSLLADEFNRLSRERGLLLPTYGLVNREHKRTRIRGLTPYVRGRILRFKSDSPGAALLLDQLREFPTCRYDDGPDALEMGLRLLRYLLQADGDLGDGVSEFARA